MKAVHTKEREGNYDLLRILACLAVVAGHIGGIYVVGSTATTEFGYIYTKHVFAVYLYRAMTGFAVACFFGLSGAFLLADERNSDFKYFYRKAVHSIGIQMLVFGFLYFLYSCMKVAFQMYIQKEGGHSLLDPIFALLKGAPFYHLWFLCVLGGIYLLVPLLVRYRSMVTPKVFSVVAWAIYFLGRVHGWANTHVHTVYWDAGYLIQYLGCFMLGYEIRQWAKGRKSAGVALCMLGMALAGNVFLAWAQYTREHIGPLPWLESPWGKLFTTLLSHAIPLLLFAGFACLPLRADLRRLSGVTFYIYLFHAGIWDAMRYIVIERLGLVGDGMIMIPLYTAIVFGLSYLATVLYKFLWGKIDAVWRLEEKICKALRLTAP